MLNKDQAQAKLVEFVPEVVPKSWTRYKNLYLFRIEYPNEKITYDPFFSVDVNTGRVEDFSILSDIDTISSLKWTNI